MYNTRYVLLFSSYGIVSVTNCLGSGFLWGWSQWGAIPTIDFKVSLMILLLVYFCTCLLYVTVVSFFYLSWFCLYVSYLVPLLKYNVLWFSDIHQKSSIKFFYIYLNSFSFAVSLFLITTFIYYLVAIMFIHQYMRISITFFVYIRAPQ
jgi:hypothetical protein